jgi:3-phosphoshikimate 1-carboxyvinyltransferase
MEQRIEPVQRVIGWMRPPGDKSISHRHAMLAALAVGETTIRNYAPGADCASTLRCLEGLGISIERHVVEPEPQIQIEELVIAGRGLQGLKEPAAALDAGNSGSTIRMLSGLLAGQPFRTVLTGDESLQRRPMRRIMEPLGQMGAHITGREGEFPPLMIDGRPLQGIDYELPVPSSQVKSAVLLAGLLANGETTVVEPVETRDHTEIALSHFGAELVRGRRKVTVRGGSPLQAQNLELPGDLSSAAFFICAALLFPGSNLYIKYVGLNPTRTALLDFLMGLGARLQVINVAEMCGELIGDIHVDGGVMRGATIEGEMVTRLIDEIPILAVLGTQTEGGLTLRDAQELRLKETDRIDSISQNLQRMGAEIEVREDGFVIPGRQELAGAELDSFGDHRIAMAFAVAGLVATGPTVIRNSEATDVSFPGFYEELERVAE